MCRGRRRVAHEFDRIARAHHPRRAPTDVRYGRVGLAVIALASLAVSPTQPAAGRAVATAAAGLLAAARALTRASARRDRARRQPRRRRVRHRHRCRDRRQRRAHERHLTTNPVTLVTACGDQQRPVDRIETRRPRRGRGCHRHAGTEPPTVELADRDPVAGDVVLMVGYPGGDLTITEGRVDGTRTNREGACCGSVPNPEPDNRGPAPRRRRPSRRPRVRGGGDRRPRPRDPAVAPAPGWSGSRRAVFPSPRSTPAIPPPFGRVRRRVPRSVNIDQSCVRSLSSSCIAISPSGWSTRSTLFGRRTCR